MSSIVNTANSTLSEIGAETGRERQKIEDATKGLATRYFNLLHSLLPQNKENVMIICNYIQSMRQELNPSDNYRGDVIIVLGKFSMFFKKSFMEITRENILSFLNSFRKPEATDPLHKWIGTYNNYRIHLMRFFRWLYYPDIHPSKNRPKPPPIENIPQLKRKEKSIYKPTDLWTDEEDSLFLRYCPNPRDRCYHAMSDGSACRPHELLRLRIKDVVFKITPDKTRQYAEILVNGKTGSRSIPLIDSIPYIKDWIGQHPQSGNSNSILLCGLDKSHGKQLNERSLWDIYSRYKKEYFPKLLKNPNVPPEDKQKIRELLKKPWNPYIRRHSALTEKSAMLKEHHLRQFAGWSIRSHMPEKYIHYFGNESSEGILAAHGINTKNNQVSSVLRSKQCPNCNEPNKPDSKFCAKCRMVLTYDAYNETLENQREKESEVQRLQEKYEQDMKAMREEMNQQFSQIMSMVQQNPTLAQLKPEVLTKKKIQ
jgi:integrase/recombinase XerD